MTELSSLSLNGDGWAGEARRQVIRLAYAIGFEEEVIAKIELVVTEMATNLAQHNAVSPILYFGPTHLLTESGGETEGAAAAPQAPAGLLIVSADRGPGMANPERALQDHYSTAGTLGGGLGAIQRHSEEFSLASHVLRPGQPHPGTVVISRYWLTPLSPEGVLDCEILTRAKPGEKENGDAASFSKVGDQCRVALIDGLGHGSEAFKSTEQVRDVLRKNRSLPLAQLLEKIHRAMHGGRGAVIGILRLDRREEQALYAGIGNIDCRIYGKHPVRPVSMNGSLGVVLPRCREEAFPFNPDDFFVMASDGISTRWEPDHYPQFPRLPLVMRGALLFRDHSRVSDDATLIVGSFKRT